MSLYKNKRYLSDPSAQSIFNTAAFMPTLSTPSAHSSSKTNIDTNYSHNNNPVSHNSCARNNNKNDNPAIISYNCNTDSGPGRTPRFPKKNKKTRIPNLDPNFVVYNNDTLPVKAGHKISFVDKDGTKTTLDISDMDATLMSQSDLLELPYNERINYLNSSKCEQRTIKQDTEKLASIINPTVNNLEHQLDTKIKVAKVKKYAINQKLKTRKYGKITKKSSKSNLNIDANLASSTNNACTQTEDLKITKNEFKPQQNTINNLYDDKENLSDISKNEEDTIKLPKIKVVSKKNNKLNLINKISNKNTTATSCSNNTNCSDSSSKNNTNSSAINSNGNARNIKTNNDNITRYSNNNKSVKGSIVKTDISNKNNPCSNNLGANTSIYKNNDRNCDNSNYSNIEAVSNFNTKKTVNNADIDDNNINNSDDKSLKVYKVDLPNDNNNNLRNDTFSSKVNDLIENEFLNRLLSICMFLTLLSILVTTIFRITFENLVELCKDFVLSFFSKAKNEPTTKSEQFIRFLSRLFKVFK